MCGFFVTAMGRRKRILIRLMRSTVLRGRKKEDISHYQRAAVGGRFSTGPPPHSINAFHPALQFQPHATSDAIRDVAKIIAVASFARSGRTCCRME